MLLSALPQWSFCFIIGVSSSQGFWSPEHIVQFTEMVEEQSFMATFKAELHEQGQTMYKVELVDKKGNNINQKFGTMTGTTCSEEDSGPCSRSVSAGKFGQSIKVTVGFHYVISYLWFVNKRICLPFFREC
jgi:hypothetical protein